MYNYFASSYLEMQQALSILVEFEWRNWEGAFNLRAQNVYFYCQKLPLVVLIKQAVPSNDWRIGLKHFLHTGLYMYNNIITST